MCQKYDAVADIWSMGIIVYQCLTGKAPFYANTPEALKNIYEKTVCLRPKLVLFVFFNLVGLVWWILSILIIFLNLFVFLQ